MKTAEIALLVVGVLGLNGIIQALLWTTVFRKLRTIAATLPGELAAAGDRILGGPERASYDGATAVYSGVSGMGVLAVTDRRVVFRRLGGKTIELELGELRSAKAASKWTRPGGGT